MTLKTETEIICLPL